METGKMIRTIRGLKHWSQVQLAEASQINVNTIRKYELGIRNPKPAQLEKIASALQVNLSLFYDLNIRTVGDVMSILFQLDDAIFFDLTEISIDGHSAFIVDFKSSYMRESLHRWVEFQKAFDRDLQKINEIEDQNQKEKELNNLEEVRNEFKQRLILTGPESNMVIAKDAEGITVKITDFI